MAQQEHQLGDKNVIYKGKGRLAYVDPNDLPSFSGYTDNTTRKDNVYWNPEELSIAVDLQVIIPNRNDLMSVNYDSEIYNVSVMSNHGGNKWATFFGGKNLSGKEGGDTYLTDSYTDMSYMEIKNGKMSDNETLGIESVDITFDSHFYPQVSIKFIDVHGYSLMNPAEHEYTEEGKAKGYRNFFKALFHFPYPRFLLTIKGQFGNRVTFTLAVNEFKTSFNSTTGNFEVDVTFIGYIYGVYTDLPFNFLLIAPYIDGGTGDREAGAPTNTNSYWGQNSNFVTKENAPLKTFIEFVNDYYQLDNKMAEHEDDIRSMDSFQKIQQNNYKIGSLEEITDRAAKLFTTFVSNNGEGTYLLLKTKNSDEKNVKQITTEDVKSGIEHIKIVSPDNTGKKVKFNESSLEQYKRAVKDYTGQEYDKDNPYRLPHEEEIFTKGGGATFTVHNDNAGPYYFYDFKNDEKAKRFRDIGKDINECSNENNSLDEKSINEEQDLSEKLLGYKPTIENIYRMIFAHIETFMHFFYTEVVDKVGKDQRKIKDYVQKGLNITNNTDVNLKSELLPPFPAVYELGTKNKRTLIYPPKLGDGNIFNTDMPEINFVEKLTNAAIQLKNNLDLPPEILEDEGEEEGYSGGALTFFPSCPTDLYFYLNGETPYSFEDVKFDGNNDNKNNDILLYMLCRTFMGYIMGPRQEDRISATPVSAARTSYYPMGSQDDITQITEYYNYKHTNGFKKECREYFKKKDIIENVFKIKKDDYLLDAYAILGEVMSTRNPNQLEFPDHFMTYKRNDDEGNMYFRKQYEEDSETDGVLKIFDEDDGGKYHALENVFSKIQALAESENITDADGGGLIGRMRKMYDLGDPVNEYDIKNDETTNYLRANKITDSGKEIYSQYKFSERSVDVDYKTMVTKAMENDTEYNFSVVDVRVEVLGFNETATLESVFYDKTYFGDDDDTVYRKFLFLLACLPLETETERCLEALHRNTLHRAPIGVWLYIGGLCYAAEYSFKNREGETVPNFFPGINSIDVDERQLKAYKFDKDIKEVSLPLYTLKESGEKYEDYCLYISPEYNKNSICFKRYNDSIAYITPSQRKVLIDYFVNFADKNADSIKQKGNFVQAKNQKRSFVKIGSKLDKLLKNLYLKQAIALSCGEIVMQNIGGNSDTCYMMNAKEILIKILQKINTSYEDDESNSGADSEIPDDATDVSIDNKLATYLSLKILYDKWLAGYKPEQFELPSVAERKDAVRKRFKGGSTAGMGDNKEFNNFLFMDSLYNDISDDFYVDLKVVFNAILDQAKGENNSSALEFMTQIAQDNKLLFLSLPIFSNPRDGDAVAEMFKPHSIYSPSYTEHTVGNTYIVMYTHEPAHKVEDAIDGQYASDALDLEADGVNVFATGSTDEDENGYIVPAFAVTFGRQNQSYFKNITVNMDNPRVTDYSIANLFQLCSVGQENSTMPAVAGQDLFSIYSNRSYNCSVEMMGCANIMPLMFFQLNNIPMFKGAYIITNVQHHIQAGDMTTTFTGVKMSRNLIPFTKHIFNIKLFRDPVVQETSDGTALTYNGSTYTPNMKRAGSVEDFETPNNTLTIDMYRQQGNASVTNKLNYGRINIEGKTICTFIEDGNIEDYKYGVNNVGPLPVEFVDSSGWLNSHDNVRKFNKSMDEKYENLMPHIIANSKIMLHPGSNGADCKKSVLVTKVGQAGEIPQIDSTSSFDKWCILDQILYTAAKKGIKIVVNVHPLGETDGQLVMNEYVPPRRYVGDDARYMSMVAWWKDHEGSAFLLHDPPYTNESSSRYGIKRETLQHVVYPKGPTITDEDVKNITMDECAKVWRRFWDDAKGDNIDSFSIARLIADYHYASGGACYGFIYNILGVSGEPITQEFSDKAVEKINNYGKQKDLFEKIKDIVWQKHFRHLLITRPQDYGPNVEHAWTQRFIKDHQWVG